MDNVAPGLAERAATRERRWAEQENRDRQRAEDDATFAEHPRPRTRADCEAGPRPCPWVACRHHLYLDLNPETGTIKIHFPDREPWELEHSCALDLAAGGGEGMTLEEIAATMNVTRERIRQLEARGIKLMRSVRRKLA